MVLSTDVFLLHFTAGSSWQNNAGQQREGLMVMQLFSRRKVTVLSLTLAVSKRGFGKDAFPLSRLA